MAALCYVATDIAGAVLYPGYSLMDQAVSELFAVGAPTTRVVVPLFTPSSIVFAIAAFRGWFRLYTVATVVILLLPAVFAFRYVPEVQANLPTPGLGLGERVAQYGYALWQSALTIVLLREGAVLEGVVGPASAPS